MYFDFEHIRERSWDGLAAYYGVPSEYDSEWRKLVHEMWQRVNLAEVYLAPYLIGVLTEDFLAEKRGEWY